jgi:(E)-4-hydroxy-3-methylbut-2-enyl-diphosphate synthase
MLINRYDGLNLFYNRFKTKEVKVGNVIIGGNAPIRIQTMTNTNTRDVKSTINQIIQLHDIGAEIIRIAVPTIKDVDAVKEISNFLKSNKKNIPIIADVHFIPEIAEKVAPYVQKVRINPGNYVNRSKSLQKKEYTLSEIEQEKEKIYKNILPLLKVCKEHQTAIRIGINFASLSWRMIHTYGNTPQAMVTSAMEFYEICRYENFENLIFSFKASDVKQTIYANRLYVKEMLEKYGVVYPLHIGITEAGMDIDGRIKSIVGIGTLLLDGIGDTIRVSLTESPEKEIPVAKKIVELLQHNTKGYQTNDFKKLVYTEPIKRERVAYNFIGGNNSFAYKVFNGSLNSDLNWRNINKKNTNIQFITIDLKNSIFDTRKKISIVLKNEKPIVVKFVLKATLDYELFCLHVGNLLVEKLIDAIIIETSESLKDYWENILKIILQTTGTLRAVNEYISCPSCSRTTFDIENLTRQVKEETKLLQGYKIAVMGCVVNGPGEMHDADYGIVGVAKEKVNIYRKGELILTGIPINKAVMTLINLIKADENSNFSNK